MDAKMELKQYGKQRNTLTHTLHPQQDCRKFVLLRLDYLMGFMQQATPEIYPDFIENLTWRLRALVNLAHFDNAGLEIAVLLTRFPYLQEHAGLSRLILNFYIQIVGITEQQFWRDEPLIVNYRIFSHSVFRFEYASIQAIIDAMGRADGIEFFRAYRDQFNISHDEDIPRIKNLADLRAGMIRMADSGVKGRIRVISDLEDGKFIQRCENCEKVEMVADLGIDDLELLETVLCYGDYQVTILYNVNFVLTRTQTIAGGAPYCDAVYHDRRLTGEIAHPDETFWSAVDEQLAGKVEKEG